MSAQLECREHGPVRVFVERGRDPELPDGFEQPGFEPDGEAVRNGRGGARRVVLPGGGAAFYRPYRHGGVLGRLQGEHYLGSAVLERELESGLRLEARGLAVAHPIAGRAEKVGASLRLALLTSECPGRTLFEVLAEGDDPVSLAAAERAGTRVAQMQRLGFRHADLHPGNMIVGPDGDVSILDLARGQFGGSYGDRAAHASLVRCARFLFKRECPPTLRQVLAFLRGYRPAPVLDRLLLLEQLGRELAAALRRRAWDARELALFLDRLPCRVG